MFRLVDDVIEQFFLVWLVVVVVVNSNDWRVGSRLHVLARAPVRPPRGGGEGGSASLLAVCLVTLVRHL